MLALIKDDAIVNTVTEGGTFQAGSDWVSPAYDGWSNDAGYSLATIVDPGPPEGNYSSAVELVEGVPTVVYTSLPPDPAQIDAQIINSPTDLFGGPTLGEIYNGNV